MRGKLKLLLIVILMFFFAGCSPKLTYVISGDNISESIEINFDNSFDKEKIRQTLDYYSHRENIETNINIEENQSGYKGTIKSEEMPMKNYFHNDTVLINECYKTVNFSYKRFERKYYISTSKGFQCMVYDYNVVDELSITVQTYNKVYKHNADEVNNNKYTWHITKDNMAEQSILFVVGDEQNVWYYKYKSLFIGLAAVLGLVIILGIVILVFRNISKKVNRI